MLVNRKTLGYITLVATLFLFVIVGCERKIEAPPAFPTAEYFSPTLIEAGDELTIYGSALTGSTVTIGGEKATIKSTNQEGSTMVVVVPSLSNGQAEVIITYPDNNGEFVFVPKLTIDDIGSDVKEMLIGDFDGGGIRPSITSVDFTNGQWSLTAGAATSARIDQSINNVEPSPAGGNYAFAGTEAGGILTNTFGFVATIESRSEVQNDFDTPWPDGFVSYPASVLDTSSADKDDFYLNFYVNFNGLDDGQLRIFVGNPKQAKDSKFAITIKPTQNAYSGEGWIPVSFRLTQLTSGFGFGSPPTLEDIAQINLVSFDMADSKENVYETCCCRNKDVPVSVCPSGGEGDFTCCDQVVTPAVQVYIDQVVISQGGPAPSVQ